VILYVQSSTTKVNTLVNPSPLPIRLSLSTTP